MARPLPGRGETLLAIKRIIEMSADAVENTAVDFSATGAEHASPGQRPTAIELRILSVIPTRNPNPTLQETHTDEITIRSRIKSMKTASESGA